MFVLSDVSLTPRSFAFVIYTHIVSLINLYATSGRNALGSVPADGAIELAPTPRSKWYARVPATDGDADQLHVLGDAEDDL